MRKIYLILSFLVAAISYGVVFYRHEIKSVLLNAVIELVKSDHLDEDLGLAQALQLKGHRIKIEIKDLIQQIQSEEDDEELEVQIKRLNSLHNQWKGVKLKLNLLKAEIAPQNQVKNVVDKSEVLNEHDDKKSNLDLLTTEENLLEDIQNFFTKDEQAESRDILQSEKYLKVQRFLDEQQNLRKVDGESENDAENKIDKADSKNNEINEKSKDHTMPEVYLTEEIENFFAKDQNVDDSQDILQSKEYLEAKKFLEEKENQETHDKESHEENKHNWKDIGDCQKILSESKVGRALVAALICATMAALSALATVKLITGTLALFGFTSAGIAGGSLAAFVQAKIGTIVAGSWFALMQSVGVVGLGFTGPVGIYSGLGVAGGCVAYYYYSNSGTYYDEFVTDLCHFSDKHDSVYFLIKSFA